MSKVYRFTGPPENWITGITIGKWAVNEHNRRIWEKLEPGDIALLHSTAASAYSSAVRSAIVGYAVIANKKWTKSGHWWIQEKEQGASLWPYVFTLGGLYLFDPGLPIDFTQDIADKSHAQIKQEVEALVRPLACTNYMKNSSWKK